MKPKPRPKTRTKETLPIKAVRQELAVLRATAREVIGHCLAKIEGEIARLLSLLGTDDLKKVPQERVHDLRDMLLLLRGLDVKPAKGRRRDLKKIENTLEELSRVTERW